MREDFTHMRKKTTINEILSKKLSIEKIDYIIDNIIDCKNIHLLFSSQNSTENQKLT